jgi:hypothetical protein
MKVVFRSRSLAQWSAFLGVLGIGQILQKGSLSEINLS